MDRMSETCGKEEEEITYLRTCEDGVELIPFEMGVALEASDPDRRSVAPRVMPSMMCKYLALPTLLRSIKLASQSYRRGVREVNIGGVEDVPEPKEVRYVYRASTRASSLVEHG